MCSGTSGSNFQLLSTSWRYLYCTLHKYCTTIKGNLHLCKLGTLQTCCLFQQCSLLHIVSAIDWGHMCFDSPHTSTLNHSRHTYCNTNVSVSDFCKLIFQILRCVLSVCTRTLETLPRISFIEAYDIRSLKLSEIMAQKFLTYWNKIGCETLQSLYGIFCSSWLVKHWDRNGIELSVIYNYILMRSIQLNF